MRLSSRSWVPDCRALVLAAALGVFGSETAEAQGISYSLSPAVDYVFWDDQLGIEETLFYGGRVFLNFGPLVSLKPFYFTRSGIEANPGETGDDLFVDQQARDVDLRHFGADVQLNLGRGALVPFIRGGGGVLRFEPEGSDDTQDVVTFKAGGGLRFGLGSGNLGAEVYAEDWAVRVDRGRLFGPGATVPADPDANDLRHNLVVGAGVNIPLSGGFTDVSEMSGLQGAAVPIEPFVGRLDFDNDTGLADEQWLVGARAGLDFTRLFGLRGYYWRAVSDDFDEFQEIQSYGGEAQFNLNTGPGISPYLVAGVGRLDFTNDFVGPQGLPRDDETMLILGGGLGLAVTERIRLNAAARDYIFGANEDLADVNDPEDLLNNLFLSAGLTFLVGGRAPTLERLSPELAGLRAETERLRAENERLRAARAAADDDQTVVLNPDGTFDDRDFLSLDTIMRVDTVLVDERGERVQRIERREVIVPSAARSGRTVTLPVPAEGELYVRYGTPGGVRVGDDAASRVRRSDLSRDEMRSVIRDAVREELARGDLASDPELRRLRERGDLDERDLERLERRLDDRIDDLVDRRLRSRRLDERDRDVIVAPQRPLVRQELNRTDAALLEERLDLIERRLSDRIDALVDRRLRDQTLRQGYVPAQPGTVVIPRAGSNLAPRTESTPGGRVTKDGTVIAAQPGDTIVVPAQSGPTTIIVNPAVATPCNCAPGAGAVVLEPRDRLDDLDDEIVTRRSLINPGFAKLYTGFDLDQSQVLLGIRGSAGRLGTGVPLDLVPEVAVGAGDGTSFLAALNVRYGFGRLAILRDFSPYVYAGLGYLTDDGAVVNAGYGAEADLGLDLLGNSDVFIEHQGIKLFDQNRVLFGLRWVFF